MKNFLIIGNGNAVTYKGFFPLIKENKVWLGASKGIGGKMSFYALDNYENKHNYVENGRKLAQVNTSCWFTNIDHNHRHQPLDLYKKYSNEDYPHYDNYDAIDSKTAEIPMDYEEERIVTEDELIKLKEQGFVIEIIEEYNN